jgi:hypothetical protein
VKAQKCQPRRLRVTPTYLLSGLLAIGIIAIGAGSALGQQGLHVVPSPFINNSDLFATAAIADSDIWAVGTIAGRTSSSNATLAEQFNGASWSVIAAPTVKGGVLNGVDGVAANDVWAVGQQASGSSFTTLIEHWNGTSWSVVSSPAFTGLGPVRAISADAGNDVWAAGHGGTGVLRWDGQTWSQVLPATTTFNGNAVAVLSPTNVWVAGSRSGEHPDAAAAILHWDGASWSSVAIEDPFAANHVSTLFTGIAAVSANDIWAVGRFTNHWDGKSWSLVNTPSGVGLLGVTALSNGLIVAVGQSCSTSTSCSAVIVQN